MVDLVNASELGGGGGTCDELKKKRGVAHVGLAADDKSIIVRLCGHEVRSFFDGSGYALPVTIEVEPDPFHLPEPCGCIAKGVYYDVGATMPSIDGCNSCFCRAAGSMACTLMNCDIAITQVVKFPPGSAAVDKDGAKLLDEIARTIKEHLAGKKVRLVGHAHKSEGAPDKLSLRRAEAVRDYLVKAGIDTAQLEVAGVGISQPLGTDAVHERRVELEIKGE